jgi:hypothetical protein
VSPLLVVTLLCCSMSWWSSSLVQGRCRNMLAALRTSFQRSQASHCSNKGLQGCKRVTSPLRNLIPDRLCCSVASSWSAPCIHVNTVGAFTIVHSLNHAKAMPCLSVLHDVTHVPHAQQQVLTATSSYAVWCCQQWHLRNPVAPFRPHIHPIKEQPSLHRTQHRTQRQSLDSTFKCSTAITHFVCCMASAI